MFIVLDYCEKLKSAGVKTEMKVIKGVPHGFWCITGIFFPAKVVMCCPRFGIYIEG